MATARLDWFLPAAAAVRLPAPYSRRRRRGSTPTTWVPTIIGQTIGNLIGAAETQPDAQVEDQALASGQVEVQGPDGNWITVSGGPSAPLSSSSLAGYGVLPSDDGSSDGPWGTLPTSFPSLQATSDGGLQTVDASAPAAQLLSDTVGLTQNGEPAQGQDQATTVDGVTVVASPHLPWWQQALNFVEGIPGDISNAVQQFTTELNTSLGTDGTYSNIYYYQPPTAAELHQTAVQRVQADNNAAAFRNDPVTKFFVAGALAPIILPAAELGPILASAPIVKSVVGFGLGYGGATLTGVQSTQGRLFAGAVGAIALPVGGFATTFAGEAAGGGTAGALWSTGTGGVLAYGSGVAGETAGEYGDIQTGSRTSYDSAEINNAGWATAGAYLLFGEAPLTAVGGAGLAPEGAGGASAEIAASASTAGGGLALQKLLDAARGK